MIFANLKNVKWHNKFWQPSNTLLQTGAPAPQPYSLSHRKWRSHLVILCLKPGLLTFQLFLGYFQILWQLQLNYHSGSTHPHANFSDSHNSLPSIRKLGWQHLPAPTRKLTAPANIVLQTGALNSGCQPLPCAELSGIPEAYGSDESRHVVHGVPSAPQGESWKVEVVGCPSPKSRTSCVVSALILGESNVQQTFRLRDAKPLKSEYFD